MSQGVLSACPRLLSVLTGESFLWMLLVSASDLQTAFFFSIRFQSLGLIQGHCGRNVLEGICDQ